MFHAILDMRDANRVQKYGAIVFFKIVRKIAWPILLSLLP